MLRRISAVAIVSLVLCAFTARAQNGFSLEFRPGVSIPVSELGDADLSTGYGFEGTVAYYFMPHLGAYAGWSWNKFAAGQSFAGADTDFEETGYMLGLQFMHPIADSRFSYLLRAGGTYKHIETENSDGDILDSTPHGLGWEAGAGVGINLTDNLVLTPSVLFRSLSREIELAGTTTDVDLQYITAGVGIVWMFGR